MSNNPWLNTDWSLMDFGDKEAKVSKDGKELILPPDPKAPSVDLVRRKPGRPRKHFP